MLKLKMMLAWWCCRWSSSVGEQQPHGQCVVTTASGDVPTGGHRRTGLFHPQREADHYAKQLKWKLRSILMSADRVAYRWAPCTIVSNTHALPAEYKCSVIKPSNPFTNVCWVSVLTTFLRCHKFYCIDSFLAQFQKRRNDGVMVSFGAYCRFVLNSKRLLSTSCNKQGQRSSE